MCILCMCVCVCMCDCVCVYVRVRACTSHGQMRPPGPLVAPNIILAALDVQATL